MKAFIYTVKLISIPYTVFDKKTLPGSWDEYLLCEGDKSEDFKNGKTLKPFTYIQSDNIVIEDYRKF